MPHPQIKSPLRYCLSCLATLLCWALWLGLGGLLTAQLYVAAVREVPVPDFVLRRIETQLAAANLSVSFGRARFEPTGRILLEDVRLRSRLFDDPLLVSRLVYIRKSLWSVLAGLPLPDEIRLEGATLQLPAILSPSGASEPLLRDFAGTLRYESGAWEITQLAGHVGPVRLTVRGELTAARKPGTTTVTLEELTNRFLRVGRTLALQLPRLQDLEQPDLEAHLSSSGPGDTTIALRLTANALHRSDGQPAELAQITASGDWIWTDRTPRPLHLRAQARSATVAESVGLEDIKLQAELLPKPDLSGLREIHVRAAASSLGVFGETFERPVVNASYSIHDHILHAGTSFLSHGEALSLTASGDAAVGTAEVRYSGHVPPALVTSMLLHYGPKLEPYFRFGDPVAVQGSAWFTEGWHFDRLDARVDGGRLDSHGVPVTRTRGRIEADSRGNFLASDALAAIGENYGRGSYWMNFRTRDYRMLLTGQLRPPAISGWFLGNWWPEFWSNFTFPSLPRADVDLQGCWADPVRTSYFGSTNTDAVTALGADFEHAYTRIFLRPQFTHLLEVTGDRAGGGQRVTGWFKRFGDPATRSTTAWEYDLRGNPAPELYARVGGTAVATRLAAWHFPQPPRLHLWGRSDFRGSRGTVSDMRFEADTADGGARFSDLPLERLSVQGGLSGSDLRLDRIDFALAGGRGSAKAALGGPPGARWLGFDAYLKEADLARAIRGAEAFAASRSGQKITSLTDSRFIKRANGGKMDLAISGQADPADPGSLRGNGNVQITGAELGEIHLFGLLSQVLSAVWLNFSSLKLDNARGSFTIADGRVHFPDVKIAGPSAVIDARGDYLIAQKSLDFTARLKPYEESHNPLTAVVGIVINPLTSIFELKLSGPISKPNWSMAIGASAPDKTPAPPAVPTTTPPDTEPGKH